MRAAWGRTSLHCPPPQLRPGLPPWQHQPLCAAAAPVQAAAPAPQNLSVCSQSRGSAPDAGAAASTGPAGSCGRRWLRGCSTGGGASEEAFQQNWRVAHNAGKMLLYAASASKQRLQCTEMHAAAALGLDVQRAQRLDACRVQGGLCRHRPAAAADIHLQQAGLRLNIRSLAQQLRLAQHAKGSLQRAPGGVQPESMPGTQPGRQNSTQLGGQS